MPPKRAKTSAKQETARAPARSTRATRNATKQTTPDTETITETVRSTTRRFGTRSAQKETAVVTAREDEPEDEEGADAQRSEFDIPVESSEEAQAQIKRNVRKRPAKTIKKTAQTEAQRKAIEGLKKRMEADKKANSGASPVQRNKDITVGSAKKALAERTHAAPRSPSPTPQVVPGTATKVPQSVLKVQSTPGAETSILALANFRRRPRQPSLLQMVQQGDLDQNAPGEDTTDFTLGSLEDDFAPDDESTPLKVSNVQQGTPAPQIDPPEVDDEDELYRLSPQPPNPRKRKSDELNDRSEVEVIRSSPARSESSLLSEDELPQEPMTIPGTASRDGEEEDSEPRRQDLDSDTYADPLSSSPPPMLPNSQAKPTTARAKRQKGATASPERQRATRTQPTLALSTAALRALLPKRRIRLERNDYDLPTSSDMDQTTEIDIDDDELGYGSRSRRPTKAAARKQPAKKGLPSTKAVKKAPAITASKPNTKRTYARTSGISDKENETSSLLSELTSDDDQAEREDTGDTSLETVAPKKQRSAASGELKKAKAKFDEIDQWEMEFESAPSLGAGDSSSPWR